MKMIKSIDWDKMAKEKFRDFDCYDGEEEEEYIIIEDGKETKVKAKPMKIGARYYSPAGHFEVIDSYRTSDGVRVLQSKSI